jgi:hypothetical protein
MWLDQSGWYHVFLHGEDLCRSGGDFGHRPSRTRDLSRAWPGQTQANHKNGSVPEMSV